MSQAMPGIDKSFLSAANYNTSTAQYHAGYLSAANTWALMNTTTNYGKFVGVIQNLPGSTNSAASVRMAGTTKLWMNDTCSVGDIIIGNTLGAGDNSTSTSYTVTSNFLMLGIANEASAATGTIIEIVLRPQYGAFAS